MRLSQRVLRFSLLAAVFSFAAACAPVPKPVSEPVPASAPGAAAQPPRTINPPDAPVREPARPVNRDSFAVAPAPEGPNTRLDATGRAIAPATPGILPPIPFVDAHVATRLIYPPENATISVRDSTFLLGTVATGGATLTINGANVPVNPNGSFLAWLPFPKGDAPEYEVIASKGSDTSRMVRHVRRPRPIEPLPTSGELEVDRRSVTPDTATRMRPAERVRVSLRIPANAAAVLHLADGATRTMTAGTTAATRSVWGVDVAARLLEKPAKIRVTRGKQKLDVPVPAVGVVNADEPQFVELLNSNEDAKQDTDAVAIVRPTPAGTYKWFLHPGTIVEATGRRGAWTRIRLDDELEGWIETKTTKPSARAAHVRRIASNSRVVRREGWSDLRIPIGERTPFLVEESRDALVLTLYDAASDIDIVNFPTADETIRDVTWAAEKSDRVRVTVHLSHPPMGYLALYDSGVFVLRVRHMPAIDANRPLAGRVIAVDPGHPPIGSTGPTGLYEADATLAVGMALKPMLERAGATVIMTRTTRDPVALGDRPIMARRANADALVSIHLNAHPDGVNPYRTNGSGTYFFHDQSEPLARAVQRGLVRWMGLRDLGINYDNLALARPTWMPSILCEGAFVILPDQEAALRTPEFQSRYAIGILEGLEDFFRARAAQKP